MKSIVLIIPYFGKKPDYFELWKMSALQNEDVDFLLATDIEEIQSEKNIHVIHLTLPELKKMAQKKFSFEIRLEQPYKCCDYKPAYGIIFEEYIKEYDFWGHCDLDLIFGRIRQFVTEDVLEKYDKIYEHGHFCLYRNQKENNRIFMTNGEYPEVNYQECFQTDDNYAFDEFPGMLYKCHRLGIHTYLSTSDFFDVKTDEKAFVDAFEPHRQVRTIFRYDDGKLEACEIDIARLQAQKYDEISKREVMYMHFQKRKLEKIEAALLTKKKFFLIPNRVVPIEWDYQKLYALNGEKKYKIQYKFDSSRKKCNQHIKRYKLLKQNGAVHGIKDYIQQRKALNRRFAENRIQLKKLSQ